LKAKEAFLAWASKVQPDAESLNPSSTLQIQTLLFGGATDARGKEMLPRERTFKVERGEEELLAANGPMDEWSGLSAAELKAALKERGLKVRIRSFKKKKIKIPI
jgi:hypothetical protein